MEVRNVIEVETSQGRHEVNILAPRQSPREKIAMFYDVRIHFNEQDLKDIQNEALPEVLDALYKWKTFKIYERVIARKGAGELGRMAERMAAKLGRQEIAEHHYKRLIAMIDAKMEPANGTQ